MSARKGSNPGPWDDVALSLVGLATYYKPIDAVASEACRSAAAFLRRAGRCDTFGNSLWDFDRDSLAFMIHRAQQRQKRAERKEKGEGK